ncbi:DUF4143 domain-containing protein [Mobiluncus mulieris]|nr:DUF4143 domain-containing protein [Mobiluncus mulieris]
MLRTRRCWAAGEWTERFTVRPCYQANQPIVGLSATKDLGRFKLFICDTGLFTTLAFKDKDFTENVLYSQLLADKSSANLGYLYENGLAQILRAAGHGLYYHVFPNATGTKNYEVDFLLSRGAKVVPVEVKSSGYRRHASLDAFARKYSRHVAKQYLVYPKNFSKDGAVDCIPFYFAPFLADTSLGSAGACGGARAKP